MKPETILGADGREVVLIHYEKEGKIVCMPHLLPKDFPSNPQREAPHMRTGEQGGVTCPLCKRTFK